MENKGVLSCGVVVVRRDGERWLFLLLRAFGYWDFPKGIKEEGEEPLQAALREVKEETTIEDLEFKWGTGYRETGPYNRGKIARYYLAETRSSEIDLPVNPEIGRPEHDAYRWVAYGEARSMVAPRVIQVMDWVGGLLGLDSPGGAD